MPSFARRPLVAGLAAVLLSVGATPARPSAQSALPAATPQQALRISDAEFWRLSSQMSEPGGFFRSDNFTSNERFPPIVSVLRTTKVPGGVYMGVGPEQNFHYIVALRPKMAFLLDIRRQAVMQHLMYKALFELSSDRSEFISRLFSMPKQSGVDARSTIAAIWAAYATARSDSTLWSRNLAAVQSHLTKTRGMPLDSADLASLTYVYEAFYRLGPTISYGGYTQDGSPLNFWTLTEMADDDGIPRSFLATEESFRVIKDMHARNVIIPVVGNFAGPKAIRAVGEYVKAQGERITAFYLSNVEQFLYQQGVATTFYDNVATLPLDSASVFIRPLGSSNILALTVVTVTSERGTFTVSAPRSLSGETYAPGQGEVCPILAFLRAWRDGRVPSWSDARSCPI